MTFAATLDKTLRVYRDNFARLLAIAAATGVVQMPLMIAFELSPEPTASRGGFWASLIAIFLLTGIVTTVEYAAFARVLVGLYQGQRIGFRAAFAAAFAQLPTLLGCGFLMFLATGLGLLLLLVPGVYIFLGFSLAFMVVMAEGRGIVRALNRSWALIKERRGRIFALVFVWGLLAAVLSYVVGGAMELLGIGKSEISKAVANQLAAILVAPCYGLSLGLVYFNMREEKEGHDLMLAAQRLAGAGAPAV